MKSLWPAEKAAAFLGVKASTLRTWRWRQQGPRYVRFGKPGGRAFYDPDVVRAWVQQRTYDGTDEEMARLLEFGNKV